MTQRDADHDEARLARRRLAAIITVRFTYDEDQAVRRAAKEGGTSVSTFIRKAALRAAGVRESGGEAPRIATRTSTTSTTSFTSVMETMTGNTRFQVSAPLPMPEAVHAG